MHIILDQNPSLSLSEQALVLPFSTPEEMLADLQNAVSEDFPVLSGIAYEVKTVDDSLKDFLSPAFYLTPPHLPTRAFPAICTRPSRSRAPTRF